MVTRIAEEESNGYLSVIRAFGSSDLWRIFFTLASVILVSGISFYLVEQVSCCKGGDRDSETLRNDLDYESLKADKIEKEDENDETGKLMKLLDSFYWSSSTLTSTGFGDISSKTPYGKLLAILWMLISTFLMAGLTGSVASILTLDSISITTIETPYDIGPERSVGVVNGSYANSFILTHVRSVGSISMYDTSKALVEALVNKTIDVGIDTTTTLSYFLGNIASKTCRLQGAPFQSHAVAFAYSEYVTTEVEDALDSELLMLLDNGEMIEKLSSAYLRSIPT